MRKGRRGTARREFTLWLQDYEERKGQRVNSNSNSNIYKEPKEPREPNPDWISNKYNLQDDWRTVREIYLPTIRMRLGPAASRLKKLWKSYKASKHNGETTKDTAWKISQIESAIGLTNPTQFEELQDQGLQYEEIEDVNYQDFNRGGMVMTQAQRDELAAQQDELIESRNNVSESEDIWDDQGQTVQEVADNEWFQNGQKQTTQEVADNEWFQDDQDDPWDEDEDPWVATEPTDLDRRMAAERENDDWW